METYDYVIVGGGMTAAAAIEGIRDEDPQGSIAVVSADTIKPYTRPPLSKGMLTGDKDKEDISQDFDGHVDFYLKRRVRHLNADQKVVEDGSGERYHYDKLLLAPGGTPRQLDVSANGILYYQSFADYQKLTELLEQHSSFAVIGGGFIGTELAAALAMNNKEVHLIFPEAHLNAKRFPEDIARYLDSYYQSKGVQLHAQERVKDITKHGAIYEISSENGTTIQAEVVLAGIGLTPNTELAEQAKLDVDDGIVVNTKLQTSRDNIYAAGDVANFYNPALDKRLRVEHEDNANTMGELAGRNMAGANQDYDHLPSFYSDMFELAYEAVGELDSELEVVADWEERYDTGVLYYLKEGRVRGVLNWNVWDKLDEARALISSDKRYTAADLKGLIRSS